MSTKQPANRNKPAHHEKIVVGEFFALGQPAVAYDVFAPRKHPSGFPSMSHCFPRAPFSFSLGRLARPVDSGSRLTRGRGL
jgi:hypothetical protein